MDEDQIFLRPGDPPSSKRQTAEAEFIMEQIARLPTRWEMAKYSFTLLCVGAVLGIIGIEAFWRYFPACGS